MNVINLTIRQQAFLQTIDTLENENPNFDATELLPLMSLVFYNNETDEIIREAQKCNSKHLILFFHYLRTRVIAPLYPESDVEPQSSFMEALKIKGHEELHSRISSIFTDLLQVAQAMHDWEEYMKKSKKKPRYSNRKKEKLKQCSMCKHQFLHLLTSQEVCESCVEKAVILWKNITTI